jgi:hypothetical protein
VSLIARAAVFVIREVTRPALEKTGEGIGEAIGRVIGRRIDPKPPEDEKPAGEAKT